MGGGAKAILLESKIETALIEFQARTSRSSDVQDMVIAIYYYSAMDDRLLQRLTHAMLRRLGIGSEAVSALTSTNCQPIFTLPGRRGNFAFDSLVDIRANILGRLSVRNYKILASVSVLPGTEDGDPEADGPKGPKGPCPFTDPEHCKITGYAPPDKAGGDDSGSGATASDGSKDDGTSPSGPSPDGTTADADAPSGDRTARADADPGKTPDSTDGPGSPDTDGGRDGIADIIDRDGAGADKSARPDPDPSGSGTDSDASGGDTARRPPDRAIDRFFDSDDEPFETDGKVIKRTRYPKPDYPLLSDDRKLPRAGAGVFVIEGIECSEDGNWVTGYHGILTKRTDDGSPMVRLKDRYGINNYPGESGDEPVSSSVNKKKWWCIPRKEFCYQKVKFSDWGGKFKSGEIMTSKLDVTYGYDKPFLAILQDAVTRACNKPDGSVAKEE